MLAAWRAVARFRGGAGDYRAWLLKIVANTCHDLSRYEGRRNHVRFDAPRDDHPDPIPLPDPGGSPDDYAERHDLRSLIRHALGRLTDEHRLILVLDHLGLRDREMAAVLGLEPGTVKSRLSRARVNMRAALTGGANAGPWMEPNGPLKRWKGMQSAPPSEDDPS